jgi:hypothetical protein
MDLRGPRSPDDRCTADLDVVLALSFQATLFLEDSPRMWDSLEEVGVVCGVCEPKGPFEKRRPNKPDLDSVGGSESRGGVGGRPARLGITLAMDDGCTIMARE